MIDFRKAFWEDLRTKIVGDCEWCGKPVTFQGRCDHGIYHILLGHEKHFPNPEPEPTTEYCTKCGQK